MHLPTLKKGMPLQHERVPNAQLVVNVRHVFDHVAELHQQQALVRKAVRITLASERMAFKFICY